MKEKDQVQENIKDKHLEHVKYETSPVRTYKQLDVTWLQKNKIRRRSKKKTRLNRSWYGDLFLIIFLLGFAIFSAYPLLFTVFNSLKPIDEIFIFPPELLPNRFTLQDFIELFNLIDNTQIPITRYLFNTVFITVLGTFGHVFIAALAAYPLAKHKFPGHKLINEIIVYSLMFTPAVTSIPTYMIISKLGLLDSPWAIIIPSWGFTLGLFLMRQFMVRIPKELLEAAKIDGANEVQIFWKVVMPNVKPAWLTVIILLFQNLWSSDGGSYIFTENKKPLSYALQQIVSGGIARTGTAAAVSVIMLIVPITVFIINQSR